MTKTMKTAKQLLALASARAGEYTLTDEISEAISLSRQFIAGDIQWSGQLDMRLNQQLNNMNHQIQINR